MTSPPCPIAFDIRPATQRRWHSLNRSKTTAASAAQADADSSSPNARNTTAAMHVPPSLDVVTARHTKNPQIGEQYFYGSLALLMMGLNIFVNKFDLLVNFPELAQPSQEGIKT
jgi:hypothetical protein